MPRSIVIVYWKSYILWIYSFLKEWLMVMPYLKGSSILLVFIVCNFIWAISCYSSVLIFFRLITLQVVLDPFPRQSGQFFLLECAEIWRKILGSGFHSQFWKFEWVICRKSHTYEFSSKKYPISKQIIIRIRVEMEDISLI